jgi:hypothetical protein
MRYYIVKSEGNAGPWVLAECLDADFASDAASLWNAAVLSEEEIALDADLAEPVRAWKAGEESAYAAWAVEDDAEDILHEAASNAIVEQLEVEGLTAAQGGTFEEFERRWRELAGRPAGTHD